MPIAFCVTVFEYGDVLLVFEVRGLVENKTPFKFKVSNEYYTTEGRIQNGQFYPKSGGEPDQQFIEKFITAGTDIQAVMVNGASGYWISGGVHEIIYLDKVIAGQVP